MKHVFAKDLSMYKSQVGTTDYHKAWIKYTETRFYRGSIIEMQKHGMQQPYIDNILRLAFEAGYKAINP